MTPSDHRESIVYDLGMNNGDDTEYYLKCGYRVLAVEANPVLCASASDRFAREIDAGALTILNAAIWEHSGETRFFVNVDNDHWSSIDIGWAGRADSRCEEITVRCVTLPELFAQHGVPYFLKIDVEGVDHVVLDQLGQAEGLPRYVSVEDCRFGFEYLKSLAGCGYNGFKLLDQSTVGGLRDASIGYTFKPGSSGPFGEDVPGEWLGYDDMVLHYAHTVRDFDGNRLAPRTQWWDIHCTQIKNPESR